jgi:hypothetical protein
MNEVLFYFQEYIGIVILILATLVYSLFEWNNVKKWANGLIIQAEKRARHWILNNGHEKKMWVINQYPRLPIRLRTLIKSIGLVTGRHEKEAWAWIVQRAYDLLIKHVKRI